MLVLFVCQQACLFCSEGVRFSGLLNRMGRFVPGPRPDERIQAEEADRKKVFFLKKKERRKDAGRVEGQMEGQEGRRCFVTSSASVVLMGSRVRYTPQRMCRDLSLPSLLA